MKTLLLSLLLLASCSTSHQLSDDAEKMKVLHRKPRNCVVTGRFVGTHDDGSLDLAKNQARNMAAKKDSDSIFFDEEFSNGKKWTAVAVGYRCQKN